MKLIKLQRADGGWNLNRKLLAAIGIELSVDELIGRFGGLLDTAAGQRTLATWLTLVWLEKNAFDEGDHWRLAGRKGAEWLKSSGAPAPSGKTWPQVAIEILG